MVPSWAKSETEHGGCPFRNNLDTVAKGPPGCRSCTDESNNQRQQPENPYHLAGGYGQTPWAKQGATKKPQDKELGDDEINQYMGQSTAEFGKEWREQNAPKRLRTGCLGGRTVEEMKIKQGRVSNEGGEKGSRRD